VTFRKTALDVFAGLSLLALIVVLARSEDHVVSWDEPAAAIESASAALPSRDDSPVSELAEGAVPAVLEPAPPWQALKGPPDVLGPESTFYPVPAPSASAPVLHSDAPAPEVGALAAVVVDGASGAILYGKDAFRPLPPASLTKIATAILVLEAGGLDTQVDIDVDAREMPRSSVMGLLPGDRFTVRDLLHGLMLPSGNDAAIALARAVSGSEAAFVAEMNGLVDRLALHDTAFANPHGLGSPNHAASAYDLAMLSRYAMTVPGFPELVATGSYTASGTRDLYMANINTFLYSYPGADGLKTGYTRRAGHTLVASAVRDGHRLFAVVLNSATRDADAAALLDWAFASHGWPAVDQ
jgi:D-alanyl-D-alanine carboxypeptidase